MNKIKKNIKINFVRKGLSLVEMALVILILGILMSITIPLIQYSSIFKSSENEAKKLANLLGFSKNAAMKSNEGIQIDIDLKNQKYAGFRLERTNEKVERKEIIPTVQLNNNYSIIGVRLGNNDLVREDSISIRLTPDGQSDEICIYMGPKSGKIEWTIYLSRYSSKAVMEKGEVIHLLEDPNWDASNTIN